MKGCLQKYFLPIGRLSTRSQTVKEKFPKPPHICVSHIRLLIQMRPSWIIHESIIMHSFCWRRVRGIKNRSEWNSSASPSGVPPPCFDCLPFPAIAKSATFSAWRTLFLTGPVSRPPSRRGRFGDRKSGCLTTAELNSADGAYGGFCRKRFPSVFCEKVLQKHEDSPPATFRAGVFPRSVRARALCTWATVIYANRPLLLWYLPLGRGDQILRRCMHTFECQWDCDDRVGDVWRQSSVRSVKRLRS